MYLCLFICCVFAIYIHYDFVLFVFCFLLVFVCLFVFVVFGVVFGSDINKTNQHRTHHQLLNCSIPKRLPHCCLCVVFFCCKISKANQQQTTKTHTKTNTNWSIIGFNSVSLDDHSWWGVCVCDFLFLYLLCFCYL